MAGKSRRRDPIVRQSEVEPFSPGEVRPSSRRRESDPGQRGRSHIVNSDPSSEASRRFGASSIKFSATG